MIAPVVFCTIVTGIAGMTDKRSLGRLMSKTLLLFLGLTMVSLVQGDISFNDPEFHRKELTVLATRNSTATDFRRIISLIESGTADTTPWISHRTDFDEMIGEFPNWLDPEFGVIKAMVELE